MAKKKRRVIETMLFKIKEKVSEEELKKASDKAQKFFEKQEGYEHRMILEDMKNKKFKEEVQWRNEDYAKKARLDSKKEESCKEYYELIKPKTTIIKHLELVKMY